jgi:hypothetical protein
VTTVFLRVAALHFATTLKAQNQPHTITIHLDFLRRTQAGPATFVVKEVKLGRQLSVLHIMLSQEGRDEVFATLNQGNMDTETGISLTTDWSLYPRPEPVDLDRLARGTDENWYTQEEMPHTKFRAAVTKFQFHFPRRGPPRKNLSDEWLQLADGSRWTNENLGFISDMWPMVIDQYSQGESPYDYQKALDAAKEGRKVPRGNASTHWYPTVTLSLDIKKSLPPEGVGFLFARVQAKKIQNGRLDLEVVILDPTGDVVALSHHVVLVLSAARNLAGRVKPGTESKI